MECCHSLLKLIPLEAARVAPFSPEINVSVGCDRPRIDPESFHPVVKDHRKGVVLLRCVTAVGECTGVAIPGSFKTEMQGKIVDGPHEMGIRHRPLTQKS